MDSKLVYPEFKFFKENYVLMNKINAEYIYLSGKISDSDKLLDEISNERYISIYFSGVSIFYKMYGKMKISTEFHKWLSDKVVRISTLDFKILGNVLKKNTIDVVLDDSSATFKYLDTDGNEQKIVLEDLSECHTEFDDGYGFLNNCDFIKETDSISLIERNESVVLFLDEDGKVITDKTDDKLLETPFGSLKSAVVYNPESKLSTLYSDRNDDGSRYVLVVCRKSDNSIELSQLFLTI